MSDAPQQPTGPSGTTTDDDPLLEVRGLKKHFSQADGFLDRLIGDVSHVRAVDGVDLTLSRGETVAVVGESGCGKSTLGEALLNLESPTDGEVTYRGTNLAGLSDRQMRPYRQDLQIIFQDPLSALNPRKTVGSILKTPLEVHDIGESDEARHEQVEAMLERVGLEASHADRYPHQFSGGQQQRVGIARALMLDPELIVADEPTSALDVSVQAQILNLLDDLQAEFDLSLLFITHDLSVVRYIADRVVVMYLGEVVEVASTEVLFEDPAHPYTQSLLSSVPRIDEAEREDRIILQGTVPSPVDPPDGCRFHTRCPEIIPDADWDGSQAAFRAGFTLRTRVERGDVMPERTRERLGGSQADREAVITELLDQSLPADPSELPTAARSTVRDAMGALLDGDRPTAVEQLRSTFTTPCERERPRAVERESGGTARCFRLDPDAPGEPRHLGDEGDR